jgi:hypothetical protein
MSSSNSSTVVRSSAIGLGTIVFAIFLTIKLLVKGGVITGDFEWLTWFWVFFPLWIGPAISIAIWLILIIISSIVIVISSRRTYL